ncbi:CDP-2,3-bis-(O-geranylgeranyl)-sn-glycerol synthase [Candidatus Micrarchaeota archaeon]|nr:CDP-2,3-bis-(O-geranylgeranyl)-sn-glycerol synthase [Candidatus Micrarchaeota archaeon]
MDIVQLILFIIPAYMANSAPVLLSGWGALDFRMKFFDGKRLLGDSKTVRGTLGGLLVGFIVGMIFTYISPEYLFYVAGNEKKLIVTALLVFGAICGDLLGSFFKRRLDIESGEPLFITDQVLFILMAVLFASLPAGFFITVYDLVVILVITLVTHILANVIAHKLNLKKVPW